MLHDPRRDKKIEATPSMDGFVSWLETKDPAEGYVWGDCTGGCAVDQYFTSLGVTETQRREWWGRYGALDRPAIYRPHTFGALLERANAQ